MGGHSELMKTYVVIPPIINKNKLRLVALLLGVWGGKLIVHGKGLAPFGQTAYIACAGRRCATGGSKCARLHRVWNITQTCSG
eukprot:15727365-Heterocapsa_arctica.AAC.1